jgi:hygromycin-B 4-O-kinase
MPVDRRQATAFLKQRFGPSAQNLAAVGRGEWSTAFAFDLHAEPCIVRFGAHVQDFAKDRRTARFRSDALPIPNVIEIGEAFGMHYAVSERLPGGYIDEIDGSAMRRLLPSVFGMLDAMRAVDLSDASGFGMWDGAGIAPFATWGDALLDVATDKARLPEWRERLAASPTGIAPFNEALAALRELTPYVPNERHLIHSDLLHFNVLVTGDRISAVIDWGNALYGDFLYDIAWFAYWAPWYLAWQEIDFVAETRRHFEAIGLDVPHFDERLRACMIHMGLDNQAYSAFTGNWAQLEEVALYTLAVAGLDR